MKINQNTCIDNRIHTEFSFNKILLTFLIKIKKYLQNHCIKATKIFLKINEVTSDPQNEKMAILI